MMRLEKQIDNLSAAFNWVAGVSILVMMLLTCADVVLRFFRHPIPGTYEIVGLMGTVGVAFALAYTTAQQGHIAVEFLVRKMPEKIQAVIATAVDLISTLLFGIITWQSVVYALNLRRTGEVSLTVEVPVYPFVFGIAIGCCLATFVLATRCYREITGITQ